MPNRLLHIYIKYIGFGLGEFYGISTIVGYLMPNRLLHIYIKYIGFGLGEFYGISTIVGYLMLNPLLIYIRYTWLGLVGFAKSLFIHVNSSISNNSVHLKSMLNVSKYCYERRKERERERERERENETEREGVWFGLVWFYGRSTIVGYFIPNPFFTYNQFYFKQFSLA